MTYTIRPLLNGTCQVAGHHAYYQGDPEARHTFLLLVWLIEGPQGPMLVDTGLTHVDEMNRGAAHLLGRCGPGRRRDLPRRPTRKRDPHRHLARPRRRAWRHRQTQRAPGHRPAQPRSRCLCALSRGTNRLRCPATPEPRCPGAPLARCSRPRPHKRPRAGLLPRAVCGSASSAGRGAPPARARQSPLAFCPAPIAR